MVWAQGSVGQQPFILLEAEGGIEPSHDIRVALWV